MSDPTAAPKVSAKDKTLTMMAQDMVKGGLSDADAKALAAKKAHDSEVWLRWAGVWLMGGILALIGGVWVVSRLAMTDKGVPVIIVVSIGFAVLGGIPICASIFCAAQASSEFLNTYLGFLTKINRAARGKEEAP